VGASACPKYGSASHRELAFTLDVPNYTSRVLVQYQLVVFLLGRSPGAAASRSRQILINNVAVVSRLVVILESNPKLGFLVFVPIVYPACAVL